MQERDGKGTSLIYLYDIWLVVWTPLKNISQLGWLFPIYGKIKNVLNHQPDILLYPWLHSNQSCGQKKGRGKLKTSTTTQTQISFPDVTWISAGLSVFAFFCRMNGLLFSGHTRLTSPIHDALLQGRSNVLQTWHPQRWIIWWCPKMGLPKERTVWT